MLEQEKKAKDRFIERPAKLLVFLSLVCMFFVPDVYAVSSESKNSYPEGQYVILTNIDQDDPYYLTVQTLQDYRDAIVLYFDPADVWAVKDSLKENNARYVALVLKPIGIDINLAREFLMMSTELDDDPFSDFSYGFITGATAQDALNFMNNIIQAEQEDIQNKPLTISGCGTIAENPGRDWTYVSLKSGSYQEYLTSDYSKIYLEVGDPCAIDFFFDNSFYLSDSKMLSFDGHGNYHMLFLGNPPMISLTSNHIRTLDLYPAVVSNGACNMGVLKRDFWISNWVTNNKIGFYEISEKDSFALSILETGITGYFASIGINNGSDKAEEEYNIFLYNEPLGDIHKRNIDGVVMGFLGNKPNLRLFFDGDYWIYDPNTWIFYPHTLVSETYDPYEFSWNQSRTLSGKANRVYYGDPLFNPFANDGTPELDIVTTSLATIDANTLQLDLFFDKPETYFPVMDKFHEGGTRIYAPVEVPDEFYGAEVQIMTASGIYSRFIYAFEQFDGKTILHIEIDIPDESIRNAIQFNSSIIVLNN